MQKRPLLDAALIVLLLIGLANFFVPGPVHEVLGVLFFVLIAVHLVWNRGFFRAFGLDMLVRPCRARTDRGVSARKQQNQMIFEHNKMPCST
ncbi:MAG: hypothetical protein SPL34_03310 [Selenomonadaceae bacterium]|nr:hypothetical protein [Selenomonadaceae bacterium]